MPNWLSPKKGPIAGEAPMQIATRQVLSRKMTERRDRKPAGRLSVIPQPFQRAAHRMTTRLSFLPKFSDINLDVVSLERSDSITSVMEIPQISSQRSSEAPLNFFDKVTKAAGSSWVFVAMMAMLTAWAVYGIVEGPSDTWQIMLQNVSSIQVYLTDILLLRQQSNSLRSLLRTLAEMQSRNQSVDRLIRRIPDCEWMETHEKEPERMLTVNGRAVEDEKEEELMLELQNLSRVRYVWNKTCHVIASGLGSLWAFIVYWLIIAGWVALGPSLKFSDTWQLYVNTVTAIILTFTSVFLQNIQQQQEDSLEKSLEYATNVDAEVEKHLRELADDSKPNPIFEIPPPKINRIERMIDVFADTMGSVYGVIGTAIVIVAWVAVGPTLEFDDNWWLIIGTFTGLVGFIDGFVLRNVYMREATTVNAEFTAIAVSDEKIFDLLNLPYPAMPAIKSDNISRRVSRAAGDFCGLAGTSVGSVIVVIGLLAAASALKWTETGQLLCNTPTMIVEGFLLLILIQAHNLANGERGREFTGILKRRLLLNHYVLSLHHEDAGEVKRI